MAITNEIPFVDDPIEKQRIAAQYQLDSKRTQTERNKLGQFATPTILATDILEYAKTMMPPHQQIRFLDPAFGTGSFYAALLRSWPLSQIAQAWGYEIDLHYGQEAARLWADTPLQLNIGDFTRVKAPDSDDRRANLLICNPPYVRHHHLPIDEKLRLQMVSKQITGLKMSGLAGLYCYFILISHNWLANSGLAGWLIPSEFMDVNYGSQIKQYLSSQVTLLQIHCFNPDDVQFQDAYVSSSVIWYRKGKAPAEHVVDFSYGGTLAKPEISHRIPLKALNQSKKWTDFPKTPGCTNAFFTSPVKTVSPQIRLSDLFTIKRGLATGANKFFVLTREQTLKYKLPSEFLIPVLPGPRYLLTDEIEADDDGDPVPAQQLFLLACNRPESDIKANYPSLWEYLQIGREKGIHNRYLCRHRYPWFSQENRPPAPFLCTYMGRQSVKNGNPFRFILNHSKATVLNVYLMLYPKPMLAKELGSNLELFKAVWKALNEISPDILMSKGRVYGGGLHKIEPKELANVPAHSILAAMPKVSVNQSRQMLLFDSEGDCR
ncbi:MAG: class I SAM-dependent methyltransferase [bacterium]